MDKVSSRAKLALQNGKDGQTCSEAVMTAFADITDLDITTARKLVSGMAGGMGGTGQTCGAVTSAYLTLGLLFGPEHAESTSERNNTMRLVNEFSTRFTAEFGSTTCTELCTGIDLASPEDRIRLRESGLPEKFIYGAAALLEQMIAENLKTGRVE